MAHEIRSRAATIPPSTLASAPVTVDISFPPRIVERITWRVPKGAVGLMGWALTSGGGWVIPADYGTYLIAEGESGNWAMEGLHDSGAWQVTGYNLGNQPHTVMLEFHLKFLRLRDEPPAMFDAMSLAAVPDLSRAGPPVTRRR